ncbi:uncharacterized protein LOC116307431 [Actinia tenebrosa]|uniref:Uncharacterized protein LOC116307431 n=1 Tax=Actinia tenebrosa TaxID=6105 RepID=A0A6P8J1S5_ACTTE|nr:uncharacterized protein LOC116307431 [Actinia tenebrosa]
MAAIVGRMVRSTTISCRIAPFLSRLSKNSTPLLKPHETRSRLFIPFGSFPSCWRRWQSTEGAIEDRAKLRTWLDKAKSANWLSRWINDVDEIESSLMSDEEYVEREKLIQKMTEMYFDNPSKKWDAEFFEEVFDTLMKYNDRVGTEIFLEMMREMQVEVNPQLLAKVELFVKKARDASWFED